MQTSCGEQKKKKKEMTNNETRCPVARNCFERKRTQDVIVRGKMKSEKETEAMEVRESKVE